MKNLHLVVLCLIIPTTVFCEPSKTPAPTTTAKKIEPTRIPVRAAKDLDYAMISMGYIANAVINKKQQEAQEEIEREQKEDRAKVREIEKLYGIKMFDEHWIRCCDTLDPLTGIVKRDGFKTR